MGKMEDGNFKQHKFMLLKMEILKKSQKEILAIKKQRQKQEKQTPRTKNQKTTNNL